MCKDEEDVRTLVEVLDSSWINPFSGDQSDIAAPSSGRVASDDVAKELLEENWKDSL